METRFKIGENAEIQSGAIVGLVYKEDCAAAMIGKNSVIRAGTIIYGDVKAGDNFQTGHHAMIREKCTFGRYVLVGTGSVLDGYVDIADFVKIESNCYICTHVKIGTRVFIGPNTIFTNDKYPLKNRDAYQPLGPVIGDFVTISAGCIILPGIKVGKGAFLAAGSVVTKDVPAFSLAKGNPARAVGMPNYLRERNTALNWREVIDEKRDYDWTHRMRKAILEASSGLKKD
jgi:acetyltransferase-like isoleucine patch superfamily enzyme